MSNRNLAAFQPVSKRKLAAAAVENQPAGQSISQLLKILTNILGLVDGFSRREVQSGTPRTAQLQILRQLRRAVLTRHFVINRNASKKPKQIRRRKK